jgi:hypothetical protein
VQSTILAGLAAGWYSISSNNNAFTSITSHNSLLTYTWSTLRVTLCALCAECFGFIPLQRVIFNAVETTKEKHIGNENSEHKVSKVVLFC